MQVHYIKNQRTKRNKILGRVLPYKRLMGMCRWLRTYFHDWVDYNGVEFSTELLEPGRTLSDFWGKTVLHIYS